MQDVRKRLQLRKVKTMQSVRLLQRFMKGKASELIYQVAWRAGEGTYTHKRKHIYVHISYTFACKFIYVHIFASA